MMYKVDSAESYKTALNCQKSIKGAIGWHLSWFLIKSPSIYSDKSKIRQEIYTDQDFYENVFENSLIRVFGLFGAISKFEPLGHFDLTVGLPNFIPLKIVSADGRALK